MLEAAPGLYVAPRLSAAVRGRIWAVLSDWFNPQSDAGYVMIWADGAQPTGVSIQTLGEPPVDLVDYDGVILARRPPLGEEEGQE
ncbi:putative CRISPR-associated Cas2 family protein [Magnetofaba australis IT-1]|uniref:Putative CRISPR-associated Cas2 family protein n=2 Tax=Magnetofaba TaxID=1472292 RepID=A0A1Y2K0J5_9PROT|nr:putative CRISPR-associated Cas2 family protein [Magnetofaba australis IT-1]